MASVKWSELFRWSLVEVEFGVPKKDITDDLNHIKYKYFLYKDTSILIDHITTIEKKVRVKKIVLKWIPTPIRRQIQKAMLQSFK